MKLLTGLDAEYATRPDGSVSVTAQEARDLESAARKNRSRILKFSRLDPKVLASLRNRREMLEVSERDWAKHRQNVTPKQLRAARTEAGLLRADALDSLHHFVGHDAAVQAQIDEIREGEGLPDLIEDLGRVSELLVTHAASLKKADLRKDAAKRATALAELLGSETAEHASDEQGALFQSLRNRAYWYLAEASREVREAARYVFRKDPKARALFREHRSRARSKKKPKGDPKTA